MSKAKGTMLFVEKKADSKMTVKERMVLAAKKGGPEGKEKKDADNDADSLDSSEQMDVFSPHKKKVLTEEEEWEQFVQESENRKLNRVASGTTLRDVSEYEDEIAHVRRMVLSSRFSTPSLIPDYVKVAFKNMKMTREIEAMSESIDGKAATKTMNITEIFDQIENALMEDHVRDQFLVEKKEFLEEKKAKWTEKKAKEKSKIYAAAEKGFTADGLISVAKMLEIQQEIAAQRAVFEMREGKSEDQWIIHQFKMEAINGFKQALQDTPEGELARADLENTMGPSHLTLIRNLDKHRKLVASSKPEKYRKKAALAVQMDEFTGDRDHNAMHGSSVLKSLSMHFDGTFHTNSFIGPGMLLHNNGLCIIGIFSGDCINDLGLLVNIKEGWWYKGELSGSKRHGFGVWTWITRGIMYEGLWDQDRIHGFGRMTSLSNGSYIAGRWNFGILDEYGRLLDDYGNMHSIKCPARRFGKNVFKPELASFLQGGKICDSNLDDHNKCVRFAESAKSLIALSMHKIKIAENNALAALDKVQDKEQLQQLLAFSGVNFVVTDPAIAEKFGMSEKIYSATKTVTDESEIVRGIIEEPVSLNAKEFACSSHFCIGDENDCICVVKAAEARRLITLFASVSGQEVLELIDAALSDAKPLLKFNSDTCEYILFNEHHISVDVEDDETFEHSYFLCGPVFHRACHSLRCFYGLKMWKWYKSMKWFRVLKSAKALNRSLRSVYGDGEFTERSESSFFSRWMIQDDSRPQTARSFLEVSKSNADIGRIRHSLAAYIDPVYYDKPPELDELRDINIRADAAYEGYTIEIFEDELELICRVPSKRAILNNDSGAGHGAALKNTPKSILSSYSSAPSVTSSRLSSRPPTKSGKTSKSKRSSGNNDLFYHQNNEGAGVVHSRPGSAVRFMPSSFDTSETLISTLVLGARVADPQSLTNFLKKNKGTSDSEESDQEGIREDDDSDVDVEYNEPDNYLEDHSEAIDGNRELQQEYSDASKSVKMLLRDGFSHYGLHLQWDLKEIPSFETHRNIDIFEANEAASVAGSACSSLPSSYARLLFS